MNKIYTIVAAILIGSTGISLNAQVVTYNYTGGVQTYVVPPCVTSVTIDAQGAQGGGPNGGLGGQGIATVPVTPGSTLYIYVGGQPTVQLGPGGFNGGGATLALPCGGPSDGWPGGGASDVRTTASLNDRMVVGGGGAGGGWSNGLGGSGGGSIGTDGAASWIAGTHGKGGTQSAGGLGGYYTGNSQSAGSGSFGIGGDAGPPNTYCTGGAGGGGWYGGGGGYVSAGGGGSSYISYPGSTSTSTVAGTRSGNGQVIITSIPGNPPAPTAISGTTNICTNGTGSFTIPPVGGATSYTWSVSAGATITSGQGTTSINVAFTNLSGTISVTADNICGSSPATTFTYTIIPPPSVTINSTTLAVCPGGSVTLSGSGATSYVWTGGITDAVPFTPVVTNTYTVTGTDGNGCTNTATTTVTVYTLPTVVAQSSTPTICSGGSVTLSGSGATTYTWTGGAIDAVPFSPTITDTYTVTGTDANGCMNTATTTVTVNSLPTVMAQSSAPMICFGDAVTLSGSGATTYTWTGGAIDAVPFSPAISDTYTVTGTDANGCTNTATTTVVVNQLPIVVAQSTTTTLCEGGSVTLDGSGASTYTWTGGVNDGVPFTPTVTDTYTVTGTDANGCSNTDMVTVTVNPLPTVTGMAAMNMVCLDDATVALTGSPVGGTWSGPAVTGATFDPMTAGAGMHTTVYTFTDGNGCTDTAQANINVDLCLSAGSNTLENSANVFPNPNSGVFTLTVNANIGDMLVEIVDMQGRVVYTSSENNVQSGYTKQISLDNVADGIYMLRLTSADEQQVMRILVQK